MSTAAFAEDVRVVDPVRINKQSTPFLEARRLLGVAVHEAEHLSEAIAKEGQAQNLGKAELFPQLHGAGSHLVSKEVTSWLDHPQRPKVVTEARHMGPQSHHKFLAHKECQRRGSSVKRSASVAFRLW